MTKPYQRPRFTTFSWYHGYDYTYYYHFYYAFEPRNPVALLYYCNQQLQCSDNNKTYVILLQLDCCGQAVLIGMKIGKGKRLKNSHEMRKFDFKEKFMVFKLFMF